MANPDFKTAVTAIRDLQKRASSPKDPTDTGTVGTGAAAAAAPAKDQPASSTAPSAQPQDLPGSVAAGSTPGTPAAKPTDDASVKTLSDLDKVAARTLKAANELATMVQPAAGKVNPVPKKDDKAPKADDKAPKKDDKAPKDEKSAGAPDAAQLQLATTTLAKIATIILSTEKGAAFAESAIEAHLGAQSARETMEAAVKSAAAMQDAEELAVLQELEKRAALEQIEAEKQALAQHAAALQAEFDKLPPAEKKAAEDLYAQHRHNISKCKTQEEVNAYNYGCKVAAEMLDAGAEAPEMEGGTQPLSLEEMISMIAAKVESGEIDEATAQALVEQLTAGAGGEAGAEGAAPGGEEMPPAEEPLPEELKEAHAKVASLVEKFVPTTAAA